MQLFEVLIFVYIAYLRQSVLHITMIKRIIDELSPIRPLGLGKYDQNKSETSADAVDRHWCKIVEIEQIIERLRIITRFV